MNSVLRANMPTTPRGEIEGEIWRIKRLRQSASWKAKKLAPLYEKLRREP